MRRSTMECVTTGSWFHLCGSDAGWSVQRNDGRPAQFARGILIRGGRGASGGRGGGRLCRRRGAPAAATVREDDVVVFVIVVRPPGPVDEDFSPHGGRGAQAGRQGRKRGRGRGRSHGPEGEHVVLARCC